MADNRRRKGNYAHISEMLSGIINSIRREAPTDLSRIRDEWDRVVDPAIAPFARPEALRNETLLVKVASAAVIHRLRFMTPDLIAEINRNMGEDRITEIRYTTGTL